MTGTREHRDALVALETIVAFEKSSARKNERFGDSTAIDLAACIKVAKDALAHYEKES